MKLFIRNERQLWWKKNRYDYSQVENVWVSYIYNYTDYNYTNYEDLSYKYQLEFEELDFFANESYYMTMYRSFESITDLIDQFNYVGYHDVCIYPPRKDLVWLDERVHNNSGRADSYADALKKHHKVQFVYYGHSEREQTGTELKITNFKNKPNIEEKWCENLEITEKVENVEKV